MLSLCEIGIVVSSSAYGVAMLDIDEIRGLRFFFFKQKTAYEI